ncbi:WhiB family transcriptional regulator [Rhodococcus sp. ARP2]|uniref:WhiB family transcriptional regulator n=1 Tax=Rhodococcus sp. ARP2 TaxID=1661385 RepID=UPI00064C43FE|nr:WhiB family transcriptional regulator [Rhodococcus sp. ARP2]
MASRVPEVDKKPRGSKYATAPIFEITALVDERLTGAACRGMAPLFDAHLDDETDTQREYRYHRAKTICLGCPVRAECANAATEHDAIGIWNGRLQDTDNRKKTA